MEGMRPSLDDDDRSIMIIDFLKTFLPRDAAMLGGIGSRNSVRLSVRLSVSLSHACFLTNPKNLPAIFLYHMKGQSF